MHRHVSALATCGYARVASGVGRDYGGEVDRALRHVGELAELRGLGPGSHVCCLLESGTQFDTLTAECLAEGVVAGQKLFRFTPAPAEPEPDVTVVDPWGTFLQSGPLVASSVYSMFRRETARARREGYLGLRLIADMDWLLAHPPSPSDLLAFELVLDEVVAELQATVVCAYRVANHPPESIAELVAVHPLSAGKVPADLNFRMWNIDRGTWELSGEIDILNSEQFHRTLATASAHGPLRRLCLGQLTFISADGIAALAEAAAAQPAHRIVLQGATKLFQQCWNYLGLAHQLPHVTFEQVLDDRE
jgi:anti-anti-sigma regulatory factor